MHFYLLAAGCLDRGQGMGARNRLGTKEGQLETHASKEEEGGRACFVLM